MSGSNSLFAVIGAHLAIDDLEPSKEIVQLSLPLFPWVGKVQERP